MLEGLPEVVPGELRGAHGRVLGRRMDLEEMTANVGSAAPPTPKPTAHRAERPWQSGGTPDGPSRAGLEVGRDEFEELCGAQRTMGHEVAPERRESATASYIGTAVGAKKRKPRVTMSWPCSA